MKKATTLLVIVSFLFVGLSPLFADDSDIFGRSVQPNVMILLDSSGSMADDVPSNVYDPSTTYPIINKCGNSKTAACASATVYKDAGSNKYTSAYANIAAVPSATAQTALSASGYWTGKISGTTVNLYVGNYLNWKLSGNYPSMEPKIVIAKRVITNLLNNVEGVAFGVMKFNAAENGAAMVGPIGTSTATLVTAVNAINEGGTTPLGEQIRDGGKYFKGTFPNGGSFYASPITVSCQPNFIIVISDGLYNHPIDPRVEATNRFTQDHSATFPGTQNVIVDTIGFGLAQGDIDAGGITVLQQTAANGGGSFYLTANATELEDALQRAISQIIAATFTFASPVIPTTSTTGSDKIYTAAFQTDAVRPFWHGFLKAYQRNSSGLVPVDANGIPLSSSLVWDAGQLLSAKTAASRTMYTVIGGSLQSFVKTNASITTTLLNVATSTDRDKVIDFTRGIDAYDEDLDGNTTEERGWKLGDIFHSNPVLVPPPFLPSTDSSFAAFATSRAGRTTLVLAGANDGQLHAFRESDGAELWSFIPPDFLATLQDLTARSAIHEFFVDSSPIVADIKVGSTWKTIVVFGERRGGKNYHCLDISDTSNPTYLWSFTDAKMGETWSEPSIGKIKMADGTTKFVAFIGGGYDTGSNNRKGKAFFVIDLGTGTKLWEYYNNGTMDDHQYMNFSLAANTAAADLDNDGYINSVYVGDIGGQLWKFDVSPAATLTGSLVNNWTGKRLFAASPGQANPPAVGEYFPTQAIYVPPSITRDDSGNLWVFFGTGDRNHPVNDSNNRFYGIKDNTPMTNGSTLTESSLVNVTTTYQTASQGWFMALANDEKVLAAANVFNKVVFFSSFTPTNTLSCQGGGGDAKLYACRVTSGYAGINWSTGASLTTAAGSNGSTLSSGDSNRSIGIGTGIATKPVVILGASGATVTASVITATTDQQISSNPAPPPALKKIIYWKEVF